jgi:hypothetical protein
MGDAWYHGTKNVVAFSAGGNGTVQTGDVRERFLTA